LIKQDSVSEIKEALDIMELPTFINLRELKSKYKKLASTNHPDFGGNEEMMAKINHSFELLKNYMINFRFAFSKEEIYKQFPQDAHVNKFRF
jgi:DnaJ-class molecular chaperone